MARWPTRPVRDCVESLKRWGRKIALASSSWRIRADASSLGMAQTAAVRCRKSAAERIDNIGNVSALAIIEPSETTAKDIEGATQAAVDIAADIMAEAKQLATELRANGKKMGEHLKEFAALTNKVSTAMRNTRAGVLNPSETQLN
jgi:hypothetical protein